MTNVALPKGPHKGTAEWGVGAHVLLCADAECCALVVGACWSWSEHACCHSMIDDAIPSTCAINRTPISPPHTRQTTSNPAPPHNNTPGDPRAPRAPFAPHTRQKAVLLARSLPFGPAGWALGSSPGCHVGTEDAHVRASRSPFSSCAGCCGIRACDHFSRKLT